MGAWSTGGVACSVRVRRKGEARVRTSDGHAGRGPAPRPPRPASQRARVPRPRRLVPCAVLRAGEWTARWAHEGHHGAFQGLVRKVVRARTNAEPQSLPSVHGPCSETRTASPFCFGVPLLRAGVPALSRPRGGGAPHPAKMQCLQRLRLCASRRSLSDGAAARWGEGVARSSALQVRVPVIAAEQGWPSPCPVWDLRGREMMGSLVLGVRCPPCSD